MNQDQNTDLRKLLENENFPLSNNYDPQWVLDNEMGPNALWLTEWLCRDMDLRPGMRVLDMGCGKCLSSVFLAREFGVQVWATDLWISAADNWQRIREAGLEDQIFPIHAEAHSLPYAHEFFDALVCVDSYGYYGTDDLYLNYFHKFVKPGGQIGMVFPGLTQEFGETVPDHLTQKYEDSGPFWGQECWYFHTAQWWRRLWARTGLVDIELAEHMPDGWHHWLQFYRARHAGAPRKPTPSDIATLEADRGRYLGIIRVIAGRTKS
jgi:cyclopropane fatty-acyl-phospholipid synthase-like methyltransferase